MSDAAQALLLQTENVPGALSRVAGLIASHNANIRRLETLPGEGGRATISLELDEGADFDTIARELGTLPVVHSVERPPSMEAVYGKRVIIIGGGAQVGQVAV